MSDSLKSVFLVFPHQLFRQLFSLPKDIVFCLVEDEMFFRDPTHLKGQVVSRRASMQALRERLLVKGYQVEYFDTIHFPALESVGQWLQAAGCSEIICYEPALFDCEHRLRSMATDHKINVVTETTPAYLTDMGWIREHLSEKSMSFAAFYRIQRRRLGILLDSAGRPQGGRWVLPSVPSRSRQNDWTDEIGGTLNRYVEDAIMYVEDYASTLPGSLEPTLCAVTFADAEDNLEDLLVRRLQDPECVLDLLETGLLTPAQVLTRTLEYTERNDIPLTDLERFFRYLIGVREYDRADAVARHLMA